MHLTYIGLGKMGFSMVERLREHGHTVATYDSNPETRMKARTVGIAVFDTLPALVAAHPDTPRTVWLMVPYSAVEQVLTELTPLLSAGDTVIEGGNSPYRETARRARELAERDITMLDAGVSGGPGGARTGACIMVGGSHEAYMRHEPLFRDLAAANALLYAGTSGAGHFVKMVHNGIEYGMMQAIAEGFDLMHASTYKLQLAQIADLYNHGSVIESRLVGWLHDGFTAYGETLESVTGSAHASGEGAWTVEAARTLKVPAAVIEDAVRARERSQHEPSFQGKIVSVMRNRFGGHDVRA